MQTDGELNRIEEADRQIESFFLRQEAEMHFRQHRDTWAEIVEAEIVEADRRDFNSQAGT